MKQLYQDVISITQDLSINFMDMKDEINANVREHISFMKEILKEEIGKRSMLIEVTMTMQISNWNYKMCDSLIKKADRTLEIANSDNTDVNELSTQVSTIKEQGTTLTTLAAKCGINEIGNTTPGNTKCEIPFHTFRRIIDHYYNDIKSYQKSGCGKKVEYIFDFK